MQQTLLAVLALMLVASQTLSQYRGAARAYNELIDDELEVAAGAVALHIMELIGHRSFDERTLPGVIDSDGLPDSADEFSSSSGFGKSTGCDLDEPFRDSEPCLDVDDVDMPEGQWQEVPFRLKDGRQLPFEVRTDVYYVDSADPDQELGSGLSSQHKKVVVKIRTRRHVLQNRYPDGFVRLERIFSYNEDRAANRYREKYPNSDALDAPSGDH